MSAAKKKSSVTRVVGPRFNAVELAEIDRQGAKLGLKSDDGVVNRAGVIKVLWQSVSDEVVEAALQRQAVDVAGAKSIAPLVQALKALSNAWTFRANQRQSIGVHSNQIAKFTNVARQLLRNGNQAGEDVVLAIQLAVQGIDRSLDAQREAERADDALRADIHRLVDEIRNGS